MRAFEYASPTTKEQAVGLLGASWAQAEVLAGGTDLLGLMKDDVVHPKRLVNIKQIKEMNGVTAGPQGTPHWRPHHARRTCRQCECDKRVSRAG